MKCGMGILDAMRDSVRDGGAAPAPPKPVSETQNKIADQIATFLRLGIAAWPLIADLATKEQEISRKSTHSRFAGNGKESVIAKKLQKKPKFLFSQWKNRRNGVNPTKDIQNPGEKPTNPAEGQIARKTHGAQPRQ